VENNLFVGEEKIREEREGDQQNLQKKSILVKEEYSISRRRPRGLQKPAKLGVEGEGNSPPKMAHVSERKCPTKKRFKSWTGSSEKGVEIRKGGEKTPLIRRKRICGEIGLGGCEDASYTMAPEKECFV